MSLTSAQIATLKTAILADPNLSALVSQGATGAIAQYLNQASSYVVWQTAIKTQEIYDQIGWAKLTPTDAPDGTALYTNRALMCQAKQFNIQTMLQGRDYINASKSNIRAGLQDALTNIPSGVGGATVSAGWVALQSAMQRFATNAEKIFAAGSGTSGSPSVLVFEGAVGDYDVVQALTQ